MSPSSNPSSTPGTVSLHAWTRQMDAYTGPDTLLDFNQVDNVCIDLTEANSSGQAQLLMSRPTRLSTIVREPHEFARAAAAAQALRTKVHELSTQHGLDAAYFAAGTASWLYQGPRGKGPRGSAQGGTEKRFIAPVLLAPITIKPRSDHDDFDLQLVGPARLNPALVRRLLEDHDLDLSTGEMARLAYGTRRLDPAPVLENLRAVAASVPGMHVEHRLLVSTFADLHDRPADDRVPTGTAVVRDLARLMEPGAPEPVVQPIASSAAPLDERDPEDELLLLDADSSQQEVVDLATEGHSFVVRSAPGTGQIGTAVNTVGALVAQGRSVLVLAERRSTLADFHRGFEMLGLSSTVLRLGSHLTGEDVARQLIEAISRNERAEEPDLGQMHEQLRSVRAKLSQHVRSLHAHRPRWGASPYQAMQALADLTSRADGPRTKVRFSRGVLDASAHRKEITRQLERAAELGAFEHETLEGPWEGARLINDEETRQARHLAQSLLLELTTLETGMRKVLAVSDLAPAATVPEWGQQLRLLQEVRDSLERFTPDIFDRPVTDLIAATAGSSWRKDHAIDMSGLQRSRLRKAAKEYIRPGVHLNDLHSALVKVQSERDRWRAWSSKLIQPTVSADVDDIAAIHDRFMQDLEGLAIALEGSETGRGLADQDAGSLREILNDLIDDEENLATIPERILLLEGLRDRGLGEFIDNLIKHRTPKDKVSDEFDLAWWQSILEAMVSGDDFLPMTDGPSLRAAEQQFRRADWMHISSGPSRLQWSLAQRWHRAVAERPDAAGQLREMLRQGSAPLHQLLRACEPLVPSLVPVWTASPLVLSAVLPEDTEVDAVVVLDGESSPLASVLPAVTRARQVVAFGDPALGSPQPFTVAPMTSPQRTAPAEVDSAYDALARVVPERVLSTMYRDMDTELFEQLNEDFYDSALTRMPTADAVVGGLPMLQVEYVANGVGAQTAGRQGVQSPNAEVRRVVQLILRHASQTPDRSLAVVTPSAAHAARVAQGVRAVLAQHPEVAGFFKAGSESFRVVDIHRAVGLQRDTVIFSLGFGRTDDGVVAPYFGELSEARGRQNFVLGMTRARHQTLVVSAVHPDDIEPQALHHGARDFYRLLERMERAGHVREAVALAPLVPAGEPAGDEPVPADGGTAEPAERETPPEQAENTDTGSFRPVLSLVRDDESGEPAISRTPTSPDEAAGGERDDTSDSPGAVAAPGEEPDAGTAAPARTVVHDPMDLADAAVHEDALVQDLSRRLVERGAVVRHHFQDTIDLVAWAETAESMSAGAVVSGRRRAEGQPLRIPVAVESDGSPEAAVTSVRERARLRPQNLERAGWNYLTLWTIEVFTDPDTVAELIRRYLGLPADDERAGAEESRPGTGRD
ncbi:hypothetical protein [Kocuria coralli]|uniref:hypothetical protein n=1 Tax=Kocuria coralli TaxID=1461025 RepID=UPI0015F2D557|nr:hypothetical protein [Kocuria coralli]